MNATRYTLATLQRELRQRLAHNEAYLGQGMIARRATAQLSYGRFQSVEWLRGEEAAIIAENEWIRVLLKEVESGEIPRATSEKPEQSPVAEPPVLLSAKDANAIADALLSGCMALMDERKTEKDLNSLRAASLGNTYAALRDAMLLLEGRIAQTTPATP